MSTETVFDRKVLAIHQLRINIKSLVAESRVIRHEERRCGSVYRDSLAYHRRGRVREEARYTHLALAYVRGKKYRSTERNPRITADPVRLQKKLERFGIQGFDLTQWLNE